MRRDVFLSMVCEYTDSLSDERYCCTKLLNAGYAIGLNPQSREHVVFTYLTPTMPYPGTLHHIRTTTRAINSTFNVLMGHCRDKTLGQLIAVHWAAFPQWSRGSVSGAKRFISAYFQITNCQ